MIAAAIAKYLGATIDSLIYSEVGAPGTNVYVQALPDDGPDIAIGVFANGGQQEPTLDRAKSPAVQVLIRGDRNTPLGAHTLATAIYDALHCLDHTRLDENGPDDVFVVGCTGRQSEPIDLGPDPLGRREWSLNFDLITYQPVTA